MYPMPRPKGGKTCIRCQDPRAGKHAPDAKAQGRENMHPMPRLKGGKTCIRWQSPMAGKRAPDAKAQWRENVHPMPRPKGGKPCTRFQGPRAGNLHPVAKPNGGKTCTRCQGPMAGKRAPDGKAQWRENVHPMPRPNGGKTCTRCQGTRAGKRAAKVKRGELLLFANSTCCSGFARPCCSSFFPSVRAESGSFQCMQTSYMLCSILRSFFVSFHFSDNEQLARSGTNCLENLVVSNGSQFSSEMWQRACRCIRDIFTSTVPSELLTWRPEIHPTGTPTPVSTPTHTPDSPVRTPDRHHSFDNVSV